MSESEENTSRVQFACPYSAGADFDEAIRKARALLARDEVEQALESLVMLERKYIDAVEVFNLLGDAFLRIGKTKNGIRYKTLHEILKGAFRIAEAQSESEAAITRAPQQKNQEGSPELEEWLLDLFSVADTVSEETADDYIHRRLRKSGAATRPDEIIPDTPVYPITSNTGLELMRKGCYDQAAEVFGRLLEQRPGDHGLRKLRERALKKDQASKAVGVLRDWLQGIEKIKTRPPEKR
jgi:tetratricopeptide (TPR) repeat protein